MGAMALFEAAPTHRHKALSNYVAWLLVVPFFLATAKADASQVPSPAATATQPAAKPTASEAPASPQEAEQPESAAAAQSETGDVIIDGRKILSVYQAVGSFTAKDRAERITERTLFAAKARVKPDSVAVTDRATWSEISAAGRLLLAVTDEDARVAGKPRPQLASEYAANIRQALVDYERDHAWRALIMGIVYSAAVTTILLILLLVVRKVRLYIRRDLELWIEKRTRPKEQESAIRGTATFLVSALMALGSLVRWLILIAFFEVYVTVILSLFPQTRAVSHAVTGWVFDALHSTGDAAFAYLPNLFVIAVILIIASQISRLITVAFSEIAQGNLSIKGFYPEWAQPSARLIKVSVLVLVLIIIFPYLPGSKSPAFQGISIFVGVLLSLGSSSAVANAIAGIILTYMRSFSVGDWVKIGETVGEVKEKNMLVTRILTPKQETITIPNATVMSGSVMNFTREAQHNGVIFHTTVTIGYDAPWKTVHRLLIEAAFATDRVLHVPAPFVLQTQLNDFYVSYELNAYTDTPREMQFIYSNLHQNIQDRFNEAGVEICSPHFASLRDGNQIAIPSQYVPGSYATPAFRVETKEKGTLENTVSRR